MTAYQPHTSPLKPKYIKDWAFFFFYGIYELQASLIIVNPILVPGCAYLDSLNFDGLSTPYESFKAEKYFGFLRIILFFSSSEYCEREI